MSSNIFVKNALFLIARDGILFFSARILLTMPEKRCNIKSYRTAGKNILSYLSAVVYEIIIIRSL